MRETARERKYSSFTNKTLSQNVPKKMRVQSSKNSNLFKSLVSMLLWGGIVSKSQEEKDFGYKKEISKRVLGKGKIYPISSTFSSHSNMSTVYLLSFDQLIKKSILNVFIFGITSAQIRASFSLYSN